MSSLDSCNPHPLNKLPEVMESCEEAEARGDYANAVRQALDHEMESLAMHIAERHERHFDLATKLDLLDRFQAVNDDKARIFQHRWLLSEHLPKERRR